MDPMERLRELGVRHPVMQVGMPAIARAELASAVALAGGIGTIGLADVSEWRSLLQRTKEFAVGHPLCAHLLLPHTRTRHVDIVLEQEIPMVSLFWGDEPAIVSRLRDAGVLVFQQVGSVAEALKVWGHGVDIVIVQGEEAGGHVRSTSPLDRLLPQVVERAQGRPVFAAGGMNTEGDVRRAVALGACGVSAGTRFLLTPESHAHDAYKVRLLAAETTLLTDLFGLTWNAPHRVVPNAATERWCDADGRAPRWVERINAASEFARKLLPMKPSLAGVQSVGIPLFTPSHPVREHAPRMVECAALYAGRGVAGIDSLRPAAEIVDELARGFAGPAPDGEEQA